MPSVDESIALIGDLIAFPTVSRDSNKALLAYVESYLARYGVRSEIIWNDDRSKGNLWATIGPPDRPGVILSGHSDVVPVMIRTGPATHSYCGRAITGSMVAAPAT
jgi:acetylornithine deacetylase/succinyl-diaminopimelate desuccinylase-like protein